MTPPKLPGGFFPRLRCCCASNAGLLRLLSVFALGWLLACAREQPQSDPEPQDSPAVRPAQLENAQVRDLWHGIPELVPEPAHGAEELRPEPTPGKVLRVEGVIAQTFPEPTQRPGRPEVQRLPLKVVRVRPEGPQNLVGEVQVTFNQAMVPLTSVAALDPSDAPFTIEPELPGRFKWSGTQTVSFVPEGRVPFSTTYRVRIRRAIKSSTGQGLTEAKSWSFTTPSLALESMHPYAGQENVDLNPTIVLRFNQTIEAQALAAAINLRGGGRRVGLRKLPSDDPRELRLQPRHKLRAHTRYTLKIPAGVFGEGPNRSAAISQSFETYPPFSLSYPGCRGRPCSASQNVFVQSTTGIADPKLTEKVSVVPTVDNLQVQATWRGFQLRGDFDADRRYIVQVSPDLKDEFGQSLGKRFRATIKLGPRQARFERRIPQGRIRVAERKLPGKLKFTVEGLDELGVKARTFPMTELRRVLDHRWFSGADWRPDGLGAPSFAERFDVRTSRKQPLNFALALPEIFAGGDRRQRLAVISAFARKQDNRGLGHPLQHTHIIQQTDLDITAALDAGGGLVMVSSMSDNQPVAEAEVDLYNRNSELLFSGRSDAHGFCEVTYEAGRGPVHHIVVTSSEDAAVHHVEQADVLGRWRYPARGKGPKVFFYTDRTPYKPGETIELSGILRQVETSPRGGVEVWAAGVEAEYRLTSPRGIEVKKGKLRISPFGSFHVQLKTEAQGDTGSYSFRLKVEQPKPEGSQEFYHSIPVEQFRAPEFEVKLRRVDQAILVHGDQLRAELTAKYMHGAPLGGASVRYELTRRSSSFRPPGASNQDFEFGRPKPLYERHFGRHGMWPPADISVASGSGQTDDSGRLKLEIKLDGDIGPDEAANYSLRATVEDDNQQAIAGRTDFVAHPSQYYVGLRSDRRVLAAGEATEVQAILVGVDGQRRPGEPLKIEVSREVHEQTPVEVEGRWQYRYTTREEPVTTCAPRSTNAPATCRIVAQKAGRYIVRATAKDGRNKQARSELHLYVAGEGGTSFAEDQRRVEIVADREVYRPGDKATLLLRSPFPSARGIVVVERNGILKTIPVELKAGSARVEVAIEGFMAPGVGVSAILNRGRVEVEGAPTTSDLGMPATAGGRIDLKVSNADQAIQVKLETDGENYQPRDKIKLKVATRDKRGKGHPASLAIMVVDEAVLSLMNHQTPDPLNFFIHRREGGVWLRSLRADLLPVDPEGRASAGNAEDVAEAQEELTPAKSMVGRKRSGRGGMMAEKSVATQAMDASGGGDAPLRSLFATTAYFNANLETDAEGRAEVEISLPDNLGAYRIMAVAIDPKRGDRFGKAETLVRVRKLLMLRPSLPRFANYGDRFTATVMVDNQSLLPQVVRVGVRASNAKLSPEVEKLVKVPAGEAVPAHFELATAASGTMRLQFSALADIGRDASQISIPVLYPATAEAFADYGVTEAAIARTIAAPQDALPSYGGLELSLSSTALTGLGDALSFLRDYPYHCAEQTASRILPLVGLGDAVEQFAAGDLADRSARAGLVQAAVARLAELQNPDGGFGYWRAGRESWPNTSVWATMALLAAERAGYAIDQSMRSRALEYVEQFVQGGQHSRWGYYYDGATRAFGLWLLSGQDRGHAHFEKVWRTREQLPLYARALVMATAHRYGKFAARDELLAELRNAAIERTQSIHFAESQTESSRAGLQVLMHSSEQTDAIVLLSLLEVAPEDPMLPKIITGLMAARDPRRGGRWSTTHANAWASLAAGRYFQVVEKAEPDFQASVWLGSDFAGSFDFKGRSMVRQEQRLAMAKLQSSAADQLVLDKNGPGKLYYRLGLRYAPASLKVPAQDQGYEVTRHYEALPNLGETKADPSAVQRTDSGDWVVKAGTNLKVTIQVLARDRSNFVVVDDPLPAGFEGQNPRFQTSVGTAGKGSGFHRRPFDYGSTFNHTQMRDDRMLLFADRLPAGLHTHSYTVRATTPGHYQLPPLRAEAMYEPERFGHTASAMLRVVK